jgi:hypothetical protein
MTDQVQIFNDEGCDSQTLISFDGRLKWDFETSGTRTYIIAVLPDEYAAGMGYSEEYLVTSIPLECPNAEGIAEAICIAHNTNRGI